MVKKDSFVICIPQTMYADIVAHVVAGYPNETCGLLASKDHAVIKHYPTANAAEHPEDFSEIGPQDLLQIAYDIDEYDGKMYAYYHSHPKSEAYPSSRDIEWAKRNKLYYIIFSHQYYPEPPYARVFEVYDDDTVVEGKMEVNTYASGEDG